MISPEETLLKIKWILVKCYSCFVGVGGTISLQLPLQIKLAICYGQNIVQYERNASSPQGEAHQLEQVKYPLQLQGVLFSSKKTTLQVKIQAVNPMAHHLYMLIATITQLFFGFSNTSQFEKVTNLVDGIKTACEENSH